MEPKAYWDIADVRVLDAIRRVDRSLFVPEELKNSAQLDQPLPIGYSQTISQPYIVAYMSAALAVEKHHKVLEIGTGSGYQCAVLAELAGEVYSIERIPELSEHARRVLQKNGYRNVTCVSGDGKQGLEKYAPYDRIIVTAAASSIPPALIEQLVTDGLILLPVGPRGGIQKLILGRKLVSGTLETRPLLDVVFVPLV
jgi:protein-L-isoaspartate(D-aspartate) O-methyltransferase